MRGNIRWEDLTGMIYSSTRMWDDKIDLTETVR
jgi:hypothetical protein